MQIETEIFQVSPGRFLARATWGFAMKQRAFSSEAEAVAAAPALANELQAAIRSAQQ